MRQKFSIVILLTASPVHTTSALEGTRFSEMGKHSSMPSTSGQGRLAYPRQPSMMCKGSSVAWLPWAGLLDQLLPGCVLKGLVCAADGHRERERWAPGGPAHREGKVRDGRWGKMRFLGAVLKASEVLGEGLG